jgi:hypothetical protein
MNVVHRRKRLHPLVFKSQPIPRPRQKSHNHRTRLPPRTRGQLPRHRRGTQGLPRLLQKQHMLRTRPRDMDRLAAHHNRHPTHQPHPRSRPRRRRKRRRSSSCYRTISQRRQNLRTEDTYLGCVAALPDDRALCPKRRYLRVHD